MIGRVYKCEICGEESSAPVRWLVIRCDATRLTVIRWSQEDADAPGARHYCGEAHAQVYISRWLEAACS